LSEVSIRQRLVAILAADAAGYSHLMAREELGTIAALDAGRDVFKTEIESHQAMFATMSRNAGSVVEFFRLPDNAVVELGTRVQI
jgi:K+ transporter